MFCSLLVEKKFINNLSQNQIQTDASRNLMNQECGEI